MASRGDCGEIARPATCIVPPTEGATPKSVASISVRPAPTSPATPTISPARMLKFNSWCGCAGVRRLFASKTMSPGVCGSCG